MQKREIEKERALHFIYCVARGKRFFDLASRDSSGSITRYQRLGCCCLNLPHSSYTLLKFLSHCSLKWDQHSTPLFIFWMFNVPIFFMARQNLYIANYTKRPNQLSLSIIHTTWKVNKHIKNICSGSGNKIQEDVINSNNKTSTLGT